MTKILYQYSRLFNNQNLWENIYMKYCPKCGKELNDNDLFCPGCGLKQNYLVNQSTNSSPKQARPARAPRKPNGYDVLGAFASLSGGLAILFGIISFFTGYIILAIGVGFSFFGIVAGVNSIRYAASRGRCISAVAISTFAFIILVMAFSFLVIYSY